MKSIFRCDAIKNVHLKNEEDILEIQIIFLDVQAPSWIKRKNISDLSHKTYHKERFEEEYNKIKDALFNEKKYIEVEL